MRILHIITIPYSDFCCDYYRFLLKNKEILDKFSIKYINTKNFFYDIESHQYIATLLCHFIQNKNRELYQRVKDALQPFEIEAQKSAAHDLLLAFDAISPNILTELHTILTREEFPTLKNFTFNIVNILSPQQELFEGSYRFCKPLIRQSMQDRKHKYINSLKCAPESLYL